MYNSKLLVYMRMALLYYDIVHNFYNAESQTAAQDSITIVNCKVIMSYLLLALTAIVKFQQ